MSKNFSGTLGMVHIPTMFVLGVEAGRYTASLSQVRLHETLFPQEALAPVILSNGFSAQISTDL